jgi:hypothetical protein
MNAKKRIMKHGTTAKVFTIAAVTTLALSIAPTAKAESVRCSNATLKGTYVDKDTGFLTAPNAVASPFAGLNIETFDGNGKMTGTGIGSLNGNIVAVTQTGTYKVNPDCTGSYTVKIDPLGLTVHGSFVIVDGGNELQIIITDPGTVITCVARRRFPVRDSED